MRDDLFTPQADFDPTETREWLDALKAIIKHEGKERAEYLLHRLTAYASREGVNFARVTPYINTIDFRREPKYPGDENLEHKIASSIRWNAAMMVLRAGKKYPELGGHLSTYASASSLYEVGFNHFFQAKTEDFGGDLLYIQGHSSPGIYGRAFLEGRLTEEQLSYFRQEVGGKGLSSYPHPYLMPDFWQFPTVSMGLGPLQAIYQARFLKYLHNRGLANTEGRKVWAFLGDGECDEVETLGALSFAAREGLDNLIFVVNCNLQRLDGPVLGNSKIIQVLESLFRGAGWNVLKVVWGRQWDALLEKDQSGKLIQRMNEAVDGDYQNYRAKHGAYIREHFFGKYPETAALVADMSDDEIWRLRRGGHDSAKIYSAYHAAVNHKGQPTVVLAKTVKGYGMGERAGEAKNITHQQKKMDLEALKEFRDRFHIPVTDDKLEEYPLYKPAENSLEIQYLKHQREQLGGYLPKREHKLISLPAPKLDAFQAMLDGTGERQISTTMAFVRMLNVLLKDKNLGKHIVPVVPDESRTFGMEALFKQIGIFSAVPQKYRPVDADQLASYHESTDGQLMEEGINEAGAMSTWMAAGNSYSVSGLPMIPFYIYYSMFGFQRVGDLAWAAGDMQVRGFLLGATAGRTTLAGEGLQHQDGHNLLLAATIPNCIAYDPCYAYELAVIIRHGLERMFEKGENVYFYLTLMNENYVQPKMPEGVEEGILRGMYRLKHSTAKKAKFHAQLLGGGTILREVEKAAEILEKDYGVAVDVWSVTSFTELGREGLACVRENMFHPTQKAKVPYVTQCLAKASGPVIAATDYMKAYADQIRQFVPGSYTVLGTDGFGRSDTREHLRDFFEVDHRYIVVATLKALADEGALDAKEVAKAIKNLGLNPDKPIPTSV
ncbi:MAG: aceE [Gammaproteobacteria bacterium]|jgi:pyruvate dehydrogenase E1 component|nr:aceE [Gammaproteobacteria bacterium]